VYRGLHVPREWLGFVHHSRTILCRAVPNLTLRFATVASLYARARLPHGGLGASARSPRAATARAGSTTASLPTQRAGFVIFHLPTQRGASLAETESGAARRALHSTHTAASVVAPEPPTFLCIQRGYIG
jgi:hypothetical protein